MNNANNCLIGKSKVHGNSSICHYAIIHINSWTSIISTYIYNLVTQKTINFYEKVTIY